MLKKIFAALAVMIFIFSVSSQKTFADTNRTGRTFTVTGVAIGPKGANPKGSFYRSFARQAAKLDALSQLVEAMQGVQVDSKSTLDDEGNLISDTVKAETTLDQAFWNKHFSKVEIVSVKFLPDGACEVKVDAKMR